MKKIYNIVTSSDENLIGQIRVLIYSIGVNLYDAEINFYFLHRQIAQERIDLLSHVADRFVNIKFYDITMKDVEKYDYIAKFGGAWAGEAYYPLCIHQYLPEEIDRILYLDAGDVMVLGDIFSFYYSDFEGNVLIASNIRTYHDNEPVIFGEEKDLYNEDSRKKILDSTFNSGSYMLNIEKLRECNLEIDDYVSVANMLVEMSDSSENVYFGDQGFLSACFLGEIKYWGYPECRMLLSTPYNFQLGWYQVFSDDPPFNPAIVHFVGAAKPWKVKYDGFTFSDADAIERQLSQLLPNQRKWYLQWKEYAMRLVEDL